MLILTKFLDRRIDRHVVIVGYLLEYYTTNASRGNNGWLITVSKALPKLYIYTLLRKLGLIIPFIKYFGKKKFQ